MINLVIVAGGKQTRFKELSIFPKVLLPSIGDNSLLSEFINNTQDETQTINRFIVINKIYSEQLKNYLSVNNLSDKINVIESTNTNGSFNTLREVKEKLPNENVLFIWSDLTIDRYDEIFKLCQNNKYRGIIFTNCSGKYRYGASRYTLDDPKIYLLDQIYVSSSYEGNIPGVYFLRDTKILDKRYKDNIQMDLIDAISDEFNISDHVNENTYRIVDFNDISSKLIEYKDLGTYINCIRNNKIVNQCQTRFFNKLIIDRDRKIAIKKAINSNYYHLISKEIEWYQTVNYLCPKSTFIPKIIEYGDKQFTMEFLDTYKPLHEVLDQFESKSDPMTISKIYQNIFDKIDQCGQIQTSYITLDQFRKDLRKEIIEKVIDRCEKIKNLLVNYDLDLLKEILQIAFDKLMDFAKTSCDYNLSQKTMKYYFCHGDLNGSNIMVDPQTLDVKFLDPRGYFGNTKIYGWKPYEYAKILYCLYGYDNFNLNPQIYFSDWPVLRQSLEFSNFKQKFGKDYDSYIILVGIIYIALAGYICQDIMKANIAYDYGMKILEWKLR